MKTPRTLSLIKIAEHVSSEQRKYYEFAKETSLVFLGEIPNMPGHCVIIGRSGKTYIGYHIDDFRELTGDET